MMMQSGASLFTNEDRLKEIEYMRVITCIAVIAVHISAIGVTDYIHGSLPNIVMILINESVKFTVPVFIFMSGMTGFYSYANKEFKYIEFLKKRLPKILIPYVIWCYIYYRVYVYVGYYAEDIAFFVENTLNGEMSYHLYFVVIIVQMYVLSPILYNLVKKSKNRILVLSISAVVNLLCVHYLTFELADRIFLKYMFFYMLGIYATLEYHKFMSWIKQYKIHIAVSYIILLLINATLLYRNLIIYSVGWFIFCVISIFFVYNISIILRDSQQRIYSFIKLFGQSSYYIYLMHPVILTILITVTGIMGIFSVTKRLIIYFVVVMPVSIISAMVYSTTKNKIKGMMNKRL